LHGVAWKSRPQPTGRLSNMAMVDDREWGGGQAPAGLAARNQDMANRFQRQPLKRFSGGAAVRQPAQAWRVRIDVWRGVICSFKKSK